LNFYPNVYLKGLGETKRYLPPNMGKQDTW
jgi:hypothetical protein